MKKKGAPPKDEIKLSPRENLAANLAVLESLDHRLKVVEVNGMSGLYLSNNERKLLQSFVCDGMAQVKASLRVEVPNA